MSPPDVEVGRAEAEDLVHAAALRWRWTVGEMGAESAIGNEDFVSEFVDWADAHRETHTAFVAFRDAEPLGMAWVAVAPRVPSPGSLKRANAEVMSVYVVPEARGLGVGSMLIEAAVASAAQGGAEHVVVHSSEAALSLYQRAGFATSSLVLDQELGGRSR